MDNTQDNKKAVFAVTIKDLQREAVNLVGRKLTDDELHTAIKGVESGLCFGINIVIKTAIEEAIN